MSIPGGICCPNGELVLRIGDIAPDPKTKDRRQLRGPHALHHRRADADRLRHPQSGVRWRTATQGWTLAGSPSRTEPAVAWRHDQRHRRSERQARARALAEAHGVAFVTAETGQGLARRSSRTTYLLDVRTAEEFAASPVPGFAHAPGGQLVQATDQWVGIKGARIVLADQEEVRAPVIAGWLRQLGHEACVLQGGIAARRI